jgi:hypothetical protein
MAVKSKFPIFRRKGESRSMYDEPDTGDLPQRRAGPDKGEPHGAAGAKGTGSDEADKNLGLFLKKKKAELLRRGK